MFQRRTGIPRSKSGNETKGRVINEVEMTTQAGGNPGDDVNNETENPNKH